LRIGRLRLQAPDEEQAVAGRLALAAGALALALLGEDLSALALVAVAAGALVAQVALEGTLESGLLAGATPPRR
jgi:hypothetical protein